MQRSVAYARWNWGKEITYGAILPTRLCLAVVDGDTLEAMVSLNAWSDVRSHAASTSGARLLYVEYISQAPWNDKTHPRTKADGPKVVSPRLARLLMRLAALISLETRLGGIVGLHAKREIAWWYEGLGMTSYGMRETTDGRLPYFEGDATWAATMAKKEQA